MSDTDFLFIFFVDVLVLTVGTRLGVTLIRYTRKWSRAYFLGWFVLQVVLMAPFLTGLLLVYNWFLRVGHHPITGLILMGVSFLVAYYGPIWQSVRQQTLALEAQNRRSIEANQAAWQEHPAQELE